jgi:nitroimidazol reductase NimA-like FMN-containing flavoprotein (pyridoxamine 5'-phosphate oxidase superfamily)
MRRKHCEITDPREIEGILASTNVGRLATNGVDGYPYVTPVNFVYHQAKIYFHCAKKGEKLDNMARDPKVCFEVDIPLAYLDAGANPDGGSCKLHQLYHCVIIRGQSRIVPNGPLKVAALNALVAKHEKGSDHELVNDEMPAYKACEVVEITPAYISAKSDLARNKSHEERFALARYLKNRSWPGDFEAVKAIGFDPNDLD